MKILLLVALALLVSLVCADALDAMTLQSTMLTLHNNARAKKALRRLVWDSTLAADAAYIAKNKPYMTHVQCRSGPCGQNLAGGTGVYPLASLFGLWMNEARIYKSMRCPKISYSNYMKFGHYTQVMWGTTTRLGCASAMRAGSTYLVCNYRKGGNLIGSKPFSGCI